MTISAYSTTAGSNTAINAINIAEGCPPGNINDAIRNLMADIATWRTALYLGAGSASAPSVTFDSDLNTGIYQVAADTIGFATAGVERARITSTGDLAVGYAGAPGNHVIAKNVTNNAGAAVFSVQGTAAGLGQAITVIFSAVTGTGYSATASAMYVNKDLATNRSLNAAGTLNASGADFAEYIKKASSCGTILAGQVCGVDGDGQLVDQFDLAHSFVIKSTDPCLVGGDKWSVGINDPEEREAVRIQYDRIAFSGQVPLNHTGATPGQYIVPVRNPDGSIGAISVNDEDITFAQYRRVVGKVWKVLPDGRAWVAVRI